MVRVKVGGVDGGHGGHAAPGSLETPELSLKVQLKLGGGVVLDIVGDHGGGVQEAKAEGDEEGVDATGGEGIMRGVVYGGLRRGRRDVGWVDVCVMLSDGIGPVVGVDKGVIRDGMGEFCLAFASRSELVGVDVDELEVVSMTLVKLGDDGEGVVTKIGDHGRGVRSEGGVEGGRGAVGCGGMEVGVESSGKSVGEVGGDG